MPKNDDGEGRKYAGGGSAIVHWRKIPVIYADARMILIMGTFHFVIMHYAPAWMLWMQLRRM